MAELIRRKPIFNFVELTKFDEPNIYQTSICIRCDAIFMSRRITSECRYYCLHFNSSTSIANLPKLAMGCDLLMVFLPSTPIYHSTVWLERHDSDINIETESNIIYLTDVTLNGIYLCDTLRPPKRNGHVLRHFTYEIDALTSTFGLAHE